MISRAGVRGRPATDAPADDGRALFALGLAVASVFHLAGNPRPDFSPPGATLAIVQVALGAAALWTCWRPRANRPLVLLCALIPVSAWLEAPVVGNHWVLAAALALTWLVACAVAAWRRGADASSSWSLFVPGGRLVLLLAYGMAAFAKLNTDFFDPVASCAVFYHDQLVGSWGLDALSSVSRPALGRTVAIAAAIVELSVPLLLVIRRTRRAGVLLALGFHWVIAFDLDQHFWDFSSVLFVAFLLFLDRPQVEAVTTGLRALRAAVRPSVRLLAATVGALFAVVATVNAAIDGGLAIRGFAVLVGHLSWLVLGTVVLAMVAGATVRTTAEPARLGLPASAVLIVPLLVALNGLTPYLELKTGFGWNMYSNLSTVDGETNHLVIPATLDLTGLQSDTVEILGTSDPALADLVGSGYVVVYGELREYAHDHPDETVTYRRAGRVHDAARLGDDPAGRGTVGVVSQRLQSFRAIDVSGPEDCQPVFSPAR